MSSDTNGIADYIDDIPMKISNSFKPKFFQVDLPVKFCINQEELTYDFSNEKCAVEMAISLQQIEEKQKLLTMSSINNLNDISLPETSFDGSMLTPEEVINSNLILEKDLNHSKLNENNHHLRRNLVPNTIKIFQNNFDILRPQPSQYNCDLKKNNREEIIKINRIDPRDFESSSSSPFDDALLKAIDEKQELNRVFQHL